MEIQFDPNIAGQIESLVEVALPEGVAVASASVRFLCVEVKVDFLPHGGGDGDAQELVELLHHLQRGGHQVLVPHQPVHRVSQARTQPQVI